MAVARPYGFEINFVRNTICGSAALFFVIILKFIFTPLFEIKIQRKNFLTQKNLIFKAVFEKRIFKNFSREVEICDVLNFVRG